MHPTNPNAFVTLPGRRAAIALALALTLGGCARTHPADAVARVNGKPILQKDVEVLFQNNLGDSRQKPSKEQADILRLNIIHDLIDEEILAQRAAKLNLTATDEEVDGQVSEMKAPFTQEEFDKRLTAKHLTLDDLKRDIRRNRTTEKLFNKEINSKINITDADINNYFNANKGEYNLSEPTYHLAQIVVTNTSPPQQQPGSNLQNSKASTDAEARKKIDMLHTRLESGEDFGTLAANFSERPDNASSGGDMGFVTESQLHGDPEVYSAVQKLNAGQITDVLPLLDPNTRKAIGYQLFRLVDKEVAGQRDLSDPRVQQHIRQQLRDSRSQLLKNAYLEMLRDQAKVENYYAEEVFKNGAQ
ncbi:MAG TPA: SurA N-terminal domain-containing protein [Acidobacteriaceae bacterium]